MSVLQIKVHEKSTGVFTFTLTGPVDAETCEYFDYHLEKVMKPSTVAIVLDLAGVDYMSSMGIGLLFKVRKFSQEHGVNLAVFNLQPQIKKILDTVQAMPAEAIFSSVEELDAYLDGIQKKSKDNEN